MKNVIPLFIFALNFYIGSLVAGGKIAPACQNDVLGAFIDAGGYVLLVLTSFFSLTHAMKHSNALLTPTPATQPPVQEPVKSSLFIHKPTIDQTPGVESQ